MFNVCPACGAYSEEKRHFNGWLKDHAATSQPPITLYDTTSRAIPETVTDLAQWVRQRLEP